MTSILILVFVLSGAAGLIYESIWSRYLGLFVGHSAYAQILVLAIFLGGMSVGAILVGRRSEGLRDPLAGYATVELATGLIGLIFHSVFVRVTGAAYDVLFPALTSSPALTIAKWSVASALILPQSLLLGMTFPLMSAGALRHAARRRVRAAMSDARPDARPDARTGGQGEPGRILALLYFANSLGASVGVLIAGFWLIRVGGLPGTLRVAAFLNIGVAVVTFVAARVTRWRETQWQPAAVPPAELPGVRPSAAQTTGDTQLPDTQLPTASRRHWRLLLAVSFGTAVASFIYEIAWIRMLSLVLGSATHSFELMLSAFILGLALGALWIRTRADHFRHPLRALGVVQLVMGLAALATLPVYLRSFSWMASLLGTLDLTEGGYRAFVLTRYTFCLAVMLPATFCAGMTLPLITRTLLVDGMGERAVGAVYGVNTLGSIVGVVLAGLILLPAVGLKSLLIEGAAVDMALGLLLLRAATARATARDAWAPLVAATAAAIAILAANLRVRFDPTLLGSGVFRYGALPETGSRTVLFYKDGRTASVTAGRAVNGTFIATNGKPDASLDTIWLRPPGTQPPPPAHRSPIGGDESTQALLPLISLAYAPSATSAAVIGEGSGMTSHFLLGSPRMRDVVTIEIEPAMIEGSRRAFYPANRRVFDDPRSHFVIDDAKSYFAFAHRRFDIIVSEPSNPWVSGVSGLFTVEFYDRVRRYLAPGGVFAQWLHLYEIDDDLVLTVLAALHRSFPAYEIFETSRGDILVLATNAPALPRPTWAVFGFPAIAADLAHAIPFSPRMLEATRVLDRSALAPLLDGWRQPNSDFHPYLDLGTERTRYLRQSAEGMAALIADRFDIVAPFFGRRSDFSDDATNPAPQIDRIDALATGAALRAPRQALDSGRLASERDLRVALERWWALTTSLTASTPPLDWHLWLNSVMLTEHDLHGGTAGVVDTAFYRAVQAFAASHGAPQGVDDALAFARALAGWDFATAARLADALLPAATRGQAWLNVDELRDGAVVAKLRTGDVAGARRYFTALAGRTERAPTNLRTRLLAAYIRAAEAERRG